MMLVGAAIRILLIFNIIAPPAASLTFTQQIYNVSIFENSRPRTYVKSDQLMGVSLTTLPPSAHIRYTITDGNSGGFFTAEATEIGGFSVLSIRTRTGIYDVLNRERNSEYSLTVTGEIKSFHRTYQIPISCLVNVKILDTNDNIPLFYENSYHAKVNEDAHLFDPVVRIKAEDADVGMNGDIYYFIEDVKFFDFTVHPRTGVISVTRPLDFRERKKYSFKIFAKDRVQPKKEDGALSYVRVNVNVKKVNLNAPSIAVNHLPQIIEHSYTNIYAIITVKDKDVGSNGEIGKVEIVDGDSDNLFVIYKGIKPNEYNLAVLKLLDRELAPNGYNLTIRATDKGNPSRSTISFIKVNIADINDHVPVFIKEHYEEAVSEESPPNTPVVRLSASDLDKGVNGKVLYRILVGNEANKFTINPYTGVISTADWLDAESAGYYSFRVAAIDQASNTRRKQSSAKVVIRIVDANDNTPYFSTPNTEVTIDENEPAGSYVTKVLATDDDSGENGFVSYSIANLDEVPFDIDPFDGTIRTSSVLDFESERRVYTIKVRASDWGQPYKRETETTVKVNIRDVNDNRPVFVGSVCAGWVDVDSPVGSSIMTFNAVDLDAHSKVLYRLEASDFKGCWSLDSSSGILAVSCKLRSRIIFSKKKNVVVSVTATDGTHVSDIATLTLALVDKRKESKYATSNNARVTCQESKILTRKAQIESYSQNSNEASEKFALFPPRYAFNSFSPEFPSSFPDLISIPENLHIGNKIIDVNATDRDKGHNGRVVYAISDGNHDSSFVINANTGVISLSTHLDREITSYYDLNITVYDLGSPRRAVSRMMRIKVTDVNDNAPKFAKLSYNIKLSEDTPNRTKILQINAYDPDEGSNGDVIYELVTPVDELSLNSKNGALYVTSTLDRERRDSYDLRVRAWDMAKVDRKSSLARVFIQLTDVNDCIPDFGAGSNLKVTIPEDYPIMTVVATMKASDEDMGNNGEVSYSLISGHEKSFGIDPLTGIIRVTGPLNFEMKQSYEIVVLAEDNGNPSLSSKANLTVQLQDVDEHTEPPQVVDKLVTASVMENEPVGTLVHKVEVLNIQSYPLDYSIVGGSGIGTFSISRTGEITTLKKLNREVESGYWLTIRVSDDLSSSLTDTCHIYVEVVDVCDKVPQTEYPVYRPLIPEDAPIGTTLLTLRAFDEDLSPSNISFTIVKGRRRRAEWFLQKEEQAPEEVFEIDTRTGVIKTIQKLDRERQKDYDLWIAVSDGVLTSHTPVFITIEDVNDNAPQFMEKVYRFTVPTRSKKKRKEPLFRVFAKDIDEGRNAELRYSIKNYRKKGKFKIDTLTGQIYVSRSLQVGQSFDLKVKAEDNGHPQRSTTVHVIVKVQNLAVSAKSAPVIEKPTNAHVMVSDEPGHIVAFISAYDSQNNSLWYSITGGNHQNVFSIGLDTGLVSVAKSLEYIEKKNYVITISVTNGIFTSKTKLPIQVMDYKLHNPIFTQRLYRQNLPESTAVGSEMLSIECRNQADGKKISPSSIFYTIQYGEGVESQDLFNLDSSSGLLTLAQPLDREVSGRHLLTVSCRERGALQREDFARIVIEVEDANDHVPTFLYMLLETQVSEGASIGTKVATVIAVDGDKGENGRITYAIVEGNDGGTFSIDPDTGHIYLAQNLINKEISEFLLLIRAMDNAIEPKSSSLPVRITVKPSDLSPPVWQKLPKVIELGEWTPHDYVIADVSVEAPASVRYSVVRGNDHNVFDVSVSSGILLLKQPLDYETTNFYNITIRASTLDNKHKESWICVRVIDENDWRPEWSKLTFYGIVTENSESGDPVFNYPMDHSPKALTVHAHDRDSGKNGRILYSIVDDTAQNYFSIDTYSGVIRVKEAIEEISKSSMTFNVWATDEGIPAREVIMPAQVKIIVRKQSEVEPFFNSSSFTSTMYLPLVPGMELNCLANNTAPEYLIEDGNIDDTFMIDTKGCIKVQNRRSSEAFFNLLVTASSGDRTENCTVSVNLLDMPDTALKFVQDKYWINILENSRSEMNLLVIGVKGLPINHHVVFSILNPNAHFEIRPTSGVFKTTGVPIDREKQDHFTITVEAKDIEQGSFGRALIHVAVMDVNDNEPVFIGEPYHALVSTGAKPGHIITTVRAMDADSGEFGQIRYELVRGSGELFNVDQETGEIQLKQTISESDVTYSLTVAAFDSDKQPLSSHAHVMIRVVSAQGPIFTKALYLATLSEDKPIGTPVIRVEADSPNAKNIIYSIVNGNDNRLFHIEYNTGVLRTASLLDYESKFEHNLTIRARDSSTGLYSDSHVTVVVTDVNDNAPKFASRFVRTNVSEVASPGTLVTKVTATDVDTESGGIVSYWCGSGCGNFSVSKDGEVTVSGKLDAESETNHVITVVARDEGYPPLSSTVTVSVTVNDFNDMPPIWTQDSYSGGVSIEAEPGHVVAMLQATDEDVSGQQLKYDIHSGDPDSLFAIDKDIGMLSVTAPHKLKGGSLHKLNVSVSDGIHVVFALVKVSVLTGNKHTPEFEKQLYIGRVRENSPPLQKIISVKANDKDAGEYGEISYKILGQEKNRNFKIDRNGNVLAERSLDREKVSVYNLMVQAMDGGGKSTFVKVRIIVTDVNDNAPAFSMASYQANIPVHLPAGSNVLKVSARDIDEGANSNIRYSIYDSDNSKVTELFGVAEDTGDIVLKTNINAFENEVYQFFIRARDGGTPELHTDCPITIFFIAVHERPPMFNKKYARYFHQEDSSIGTVVTSLGTSENSKYLLFEDESSFGGSSHVSETFILNEKGDLVINEALDREKRSTHTLTVVNQTETTPPLVDYMTISIVVMDVNDCTPQFSSGTYEVDTAENMLVGSTILVLTAVDDDQGTNGQIQFSLNDSNEWIRSVVSIDPHTGSVVLMQQMDREEVSHFSFSVAAADSGAKPRVSYATVNVNVLDYNDNPPTFAKDHYVTNVPEDSAKGTVIIELFLTDRDSELQDVHFFVTGGDTFANFLINAKGQVYIAKSLDRESIDHYSLMITATDGKFSANTTLSVFVLDVNDNGPVCEDIRDVKISEDAKLGTRVVDVVSTDADLDSNAKARYSLSGDGVDDFAIDKQTGQVSTAIRLDREDRDVYDLIAVVEDWEFSERRCEVVFKILINDVNDNPPSFLRTPYAVRIPEDANVNSVVTKIEAVDPDLGLSSRIQYILQESDDSDGFALDKTEGIITLVKPLDRERKDSYQLTIEAVDKGVPAFSSSVEVSVQVTDINDNPPEFVRNLLQTTIAENEPIGTEISRVMATSKDIGINAEITYSVEHSSAIKYLKIHPKTGVISINSEIDYEKVQFIVATIIAKDSGNPPLSSTALINVTVTDENDNAPLFSQTVYKAQVLESERVGRSILQVSASDVDEGLNGEIVYAIVKGNDKRKFLIESKTGVLFLSNSLDREKDDFYELEIEARDKGDVPNKRNTIVEIFVEDVNDNPPIFTQNNYSAVLQENRPYGYVIMRFAVTDDDSEANGAPFTYELISARADNSSNMFSIDKYGTLRLSTRKLDHKKRNKYRLMVRAWDSGTPPLSGESNINIKIVEESMYPPTVFPLQAKVTSYITPFGGGIIGKLSTIDQDPYDTLHYSIVHNNNEESNYFDVDKQDGTIVAISPLDCGTYPLVVNVTDGKFTRLAKVSVNVFIVEEEMLEDAVFLQVSSISPTEFISKHQANFIVHLAKYLRVSRDNIAIISIQSSDSSYRSKRDTYDGVDILLSVKRKNGAYVKRSKLISVLERNRRRPIMNSLDINVFDSVCSPNFTCSGHGKCVDVIEVDSEVPSSFNTQLMSLVVPKFKQAPGCECIQGYAGYSCNNLINACGLRPCLPFEECVPSEELARGYTCHCPAGKAGPKCQIDLSSCKEPSCHYPIKPLSFKGTGFAQYSMENPLDTDSLVFSAYVRTRYPVGVILYTGGDVDYSILEVVGGFIQYRWDCGSGEGIVKITDKRIDDDKWHIVNITREGTNAVLSLDDLSSSGASPGVNDILNVPSDNIFIGAKVQNSDSLVEFGYVGCIDLMTLNKVPLPISIRSTGYDKRSSLKRLANVDLRCPETLKVPGPCGSYPCLNGGECAEIDSNYFCSCPKRFTGQQCQIDTAPCDSDPCLNGGKCVVVAQSYKCKCPTKLSGKRCEYGIFCNPNPCQNGGRCEEGTKGPVCKCGHFTGSKCELDVDECVRSPCQNGGTCLNLYGNFRCLCPANSTGQYCSEVIPSSGLVLSFNQIILMFVILVVIILIVLLIIACRRKNWRKKREEQNNRVKLTSHQLKNDLKSNDVCKRNSKLCNVEADQLLPRPTSFQAGGAESVLFNTLKHLADLSASDQETFELSTLTRRMSNEYNHNLKHNKSPLSSPKLKECNRKQWDHNNLNELKMTPTKDIAFDLPPNLEDSPRDSSSALNSSYSDNSSGLQVNDDVRCSTPMLTFQSNSTEPKKGLRASIKELNESNEEGEPLLNSAPRSPSSDRSHMASQYEINSDVDENSSVENLVKNSFSSGELPPPFFLEDEESETKISNLAEANYNDAVIQNDASENANLLNKMGSPRSRRPFHRKDFGRASDVSFLSTLEEENNDYNYDQSHNKLNDSSEMKKLNKSENSIYEIYL